MTYPSDRARAGLARFEECMVLRRAELDSTEPSLPDENWIYHVMVRLAGPLNDRAAYCAGVEKAMGWSAGSVERILTGGDPEVPA